MDFDLVDLERFFTDTGTTQPGGSTPSLATPPKLNIPIQGLGLECVNGNGSVCLPQVSCPSITQSSLLPSQLSMTGNEQSFSPSSPPASSCLISSNAPLTQYEAYQENGVTSRAYKQLVEENHRLRKNVDRYREGNEEAWVYVNQLDELLEDLQGKITAQGSAGNSFTVLQHSGQMSRLKHIADGLKKSLE